MMHRVISRRRLVATAVSGAVAWLGGSVSTFAAQAVGTYSIVGYNELMALCAGLRCPKAIGEACLLALPAPERSRSTLARTILADVRPARASRSSPDALAQVIRTRSRADFQESKVAAVDGWVLSLTETRVYALAVSLPEPRVPVT